MKNCSQQANCIYKELFKRRMHARDEIKIEQSKGPYLMNLELFRREVCRVEEAM